MKKLLTIIGSMVLALNIIGSAQAITVTSLYGDKDGFGIGFAVDQSFSGQYPALSKDDAADAGTITDSWMLGDKSWTHTYDISVIGNVTQASLEVFTLGQGWHGASQVYFDGNLVGTLTDGDNSGAYLVSNWARLDTFNLMSLGLSLDNVSTITIDTFGSSGQNSGSNDDQWALDYSELKITGTAPVPEPSTLILLGAGMAGLFVYGKRRANK